MSDFAKSKTIQEQRQYLPIYSVRDELLQVLFSPLVYICLLVLQVTCDSDQITAP